MVTGSYRYIIDHWIDGYNDEVMEITIQYDDHSGIKHRAEYERDKDTNKWLLCNAKPKANWPEILTEKNIMAIKLKIWHPNNG